LLLLLFDLGCIAVVQNFKIRIALKNKYCINIDRTVTSYFSNLKKLLDDEYHIRLFTVH